MSASVRIRDARPTVWRLREIKNIRGLSGIEFYFKFFRPRTFWRLFVANIREVYSSIIRANIRGDIRANIRGNIRPEYSRERPPVHRVAVRRIQHAVCIDR